jgi:protocatechuate 3,4-dioxygenase beta subunit
MPHAASHHEAGDHDRGLSHDLARLRAVATRRTTLRWLALAGGAFALLRGRDGRASEPAAPAARPCAPIPEDTEGPFAANGPRDPNVLDDTGIVRKDIRASFGGPRAVADGVALELRIRVLDHTTCAPLAGRAVYVWHCDRVGRYSLYSRGAATENFLRGVQVTDAAGVATFTTVVPGCYPGRWPHVHFEVYDTLQGATRGARPRRTTQLALPFDAAKVAYAQRGYEASLPYLERMGSPARDGVFGDDGGARQIATVTGTAAAGFVAALDAPV